mmetsp:Transcript_48217/g.134863  ORF Transcript_48217/g.134863 Transcript_48217/m.134863 type:complete len:113 (-) Transcript_48217:805-1143(-)
MGFSIAGVADAATTTRAKPNVGTRFKQQIKKAEEVLQESYMMIPDSKNRFQKSLEDLLDHVREFATDAALVGTDDLAKAQTILSENDMGDEDGGEAAEEAGAGEEYAEGEIF